MPMKVTNGRGGDREIVVRWNAKGLSDAIAEGVLLFQAPPQGYRSEVLKIGKQRMASGRRLDVTVEYYHSDLGIQAQDPDLLLPILEAKVGS